MPEPRPAPLAPRVRTASSISSACAGRTYRGKLYAKQVDNNALTEQSEFVEFHQEESTRREQRDAKRANLKALDLRSESVETLVVVDDRRWRWNEVLVLVFLLTLWRRNC